MPLDLASSTVTRITWGRSAQTITCVCAVLLSTTTSAQVTPPEAPTSLGSNFVTARPTYRHGGLTRQLETGPLERQASAAGAVQPLSPPASPSTSAPATRVDGQILPATQAAIRTEASSSKALPLRPPASPTGLPIRDNLTANLSPVIKALALVLGLFFGAIWVARRAGWKAPTATDPNMFQVLGEFPLASRRKATIVKFGKRLLVLADSARGIEKLTEVTDPSEIEQVLAMCEPRFGVQRVSTLQDWIRHRGLQSGIASEIPKVP